MPRPKSVGSGLCRLFLGSLALTLGNPKTMIFFLGSAAYGGRIEHLSVGGFFSIVSVILVILPLVLGGMPSELAGPRRFFSTPKTVRWVQRGSGWLWRLLRWLCHAVASRAVPTRRRRPPHS